jgi:hypothetical protein
MESAESTNVEKDASMESNNVELLINVHEETPSKENYGLPPENVKRGEAERNNDTMASTNESKLNSSKSELFDIHPVHLSPIPEDSAPLKRFKSNMQAEGKHSKALSFQKHANDADVEKLEVPNCGRISRVSNQPSSQNSSTSRQPPSIKIAKRPELDVDPASLLIFTKSVKHPKLYDVLSQNRFKLRLFQIVLAIGNCC